MSRVAASVRRYASVLAAVASTLSIARAPADAAAFLNATPAAVLTGVPVTFTGTAQSRAAGAFRLAFGDGAAISFASPSFSIQHVYGLGGSYVARLSDANNTTLAAATVRVVAVGQGVVVAGNVGVTFLPGRTPIGQIYTTTLTIPTVLAGGETGIVVRYSIGDPTYIASGAPLLAIVELRSRKGRLIRRSDPLEIVTSLRTGLQTAVIPYSVPVDAGGAYALNVILRAAGGGTIATSDPLPLLVAAGPDPRPALHAELRATGSIEIGPNSAASTTFNPGLTTAVQFPNSVLAITGLYDPVSHRPDPVLTLTSGAPPLQNPDAAAPADASPAPAASAAPSTGPAPNSTARPEAGAAPQESPAAAPPAGSAPAPAPSPAGSFKDTLGLGTAALPPLLGDSSTLRGLDATRTAGPWVLHGALGYTKLATVSTPAERAIVADLTHALGPGSLRVAAFGRADDVRPQDVVTTADAGPLRATVAALQLDEPVVRNLTVSATGALSSATSLVLPFSAADASVRSTLAYASGTTSASFEYHNAGDGFSLGAGPGATADRAGWVSSVAFNLSPKAALSLGAEREETHSVATRQTNVSAMLNLTPTDKTQVQLGLRRDTQASATSNTTTDQLNATFATALLGGQFTFNGSLVGLSDALASANAATTRTATLQFSRQSNAHTLGIGLTGTSVSGANANAQAGQSLTYGFPVGGHTVDGALLHGFELQFALTNTAASSATAVGADQALSAIVSYHLTRHIALGVRGELHRHSGTPVIGMPNAGSVLRLRLDVTQ